MLENNLWQGFAPLPYMLARMFRAAPLSALGLAALLSACAPTLGPPPPGPPRGPIAFSADAFGWSKAPGSGSIVGRMAYRAGGTPFTCAGSGVVLTPETAWSRQRMAVLYGSTERAALPADDVRARTPSAPPGDAGPFVKRATCDENDRFAFTGLPDGAWYVITLAKPAGRPEAESMAFMRRVVTRNGRAAQVAF